MLTHFRPIACRQDQDRERAVRKPLLAGHSLVAGKKSVESRGRNELEQSTVVDPSPTLSLHGRHFVTDKLVP